MIKVIGKKQSGKTTKLIRLAHEKNYILVEPSSYRADAVSKMAKELGFDDVTIISEHLMPYMHGRDRKQGFLIDEVDDFLSRLGVVGYSQTEMEDEEHEKMLKDRNEDIWRKRTEEKKTLRAISEEYGLSGERIRQIVKSVERMHQRKKVSESSLKCRFVDAFEFVTVGRAKTALSIKGLFNTLLRAMPKEMHNTADPEKFLNWFMEQDISNFIEMRNLGPERITVLVKIQGYIRHVPGLRDKLLNGCETLL